ncbi:MAG TPA: hypothetical protein GXX71_01225 [Acholeplasma sp.]|nr:hypothetical protein [Acholeplasma sp.]
MHVSQVFDYKLPILLINDHSKTSNGGAIVFKDNQILKQLKMGTVGVLTYNINK